MNCNQNSDGAARMPGLMEIPVPAAVPVQGPGQMRAGEDMMLGSGRFPVGMGYVPMQGWETPYPMEHGFMRGTIFPSLDYPFVMGRCRGWKR